MNVRVLAAAQLSRAVEQREGKNLCFPTCAVGSLEQDADIVMFIHKKEDFASGTQERN
jgi:replicative DNA helicase